MVYSIFNVLRWSMSLGAKFFRIVPWATSGIVFLTIQSQVAALLAFFLPLKVVVLLGSTGMPRYFPEAWQLINRDYLILILSVATVGFYVIHLATENFIGRITAAAAEKLLSHSQKLVLFEHQGEIAAKAYLRYSSALSGAIFGILAVVALFWLYPTMAPVAPVVMLLVFMVSWMVCAVSVGARDFLGENISGLAGIYSGFGFFLGFAYLVADFLFFDPPGLIPAIVALLLLRQFFRRTSILVVDLSALYRQRHRLDAIFFHERIFVPQEKLSKQHAVWSLFEPGRRDKWVSGIVESVSGVRKDCISLGWLDVGAIDVFAFQFERRYVVKVFERKKISWFQHEAFLLSNAVAKKIPSPRLCFSVDVEGYPCHVLELSGSLHRLTRKQARKYLCDFWSVLAQITPPSDLLHRYSRSHPQIWQRLNADVLEILCWLAIDDCQRNIVSRFIYELPGLRDSLSSMPLVFVNPDAAASLYLVQGGGEDAIIAMHWGRWGIEPLGVMLPLLLHDELVLQGTLLESSKIRKELAGVSAIDVLLIGHLSVLEKAMDKQRWAEAFDSVDLIVQILDRRKKS